MTVQVSQCVFIIVIGNYFSFISFELEALSMAATGVLITRDACAVIAITVGGPRVLGHQTMTDERVCKSH